MLKVPKLACAEGFSGHHIMNVLIANAAGYGNLGDDSIRDALVGTIEQLYPTIKIVCTHPPPEKGLVEEADLIVVGGGGLLYDSDFANVVYYMSYLEWAQEFKKPNIALGVGVQGIFTEKGREYYQKVLNKTDLVSTRDQESRDILINQVGISTPIHVCADLAFLLNPLVTNNYRREEDRPILGICVRDFHPEFSPRERYINSIREALKRIKDEFKLVFFIFSKDDHKLNMRLHSEFKNSNCFIYDYREGWTPQKFLPLIRQCDLMLCTRYHAFIFSILSEAPALPIIELGGKNRWLAYLINHTLYSCLMDSMTAEGLLKKLNEVWSDREIIKANFVKWKPELQRRAYRNVELLDSFITQSI
ncbi:MAG: Polysaccharide pyruvyl transferase [Candidatus Bathyarchaeota archaeon BA1]|nr:MAG: Polysaccharide pyruvyl transferase [Candidatus Bathyarchaeota archaeon BA1]